MNDTKIIKVNDVQVDDSGVYNIRDSGSGESWILGTDVYTSTAHYANAFVKGVTACPEVLEIPRSLTDSNGRTKPVEILGRGALVRCGCDESCTSFKGKTKSLKVPRQVKVIKYYGLGVMLDLETFVLEAGSELETIEDYGLDRIGFTTGVNNGSKRIFFILPSSLSSVYDNGIMYCNLFHTIIYCGSHSLTNTSDLGTLHVPDIVVKVTSQYPVGNFLGKILSKNEQISIQVSCSIMSGNLLYSLPDLMSHCSYSKRLASMIWSLNSFLCLLF